MTARERRSVRRQRRRLVVALSLVAVVAALAVPSLGLGTRLLDFLGLSAPPEVQKVIALEASVVERLEEQWQRDLVRSSIHGVIEVETEAGPIRLWAAHSKDGTLLYRFVQMPPYRLPPGVPVSREPRKPQGIFTGSGGEKLNVGIETPYTYGSVPAPLLHGQVRPPVTAVRVRYQDGSTQTIPIVENYMLALLDHRSGAVTVEAFDKAGTLVAEEAASLDRPKPPPITETRKIITVNTPSGSASLYVKPGPDPDRCYRLRAPNPYDRPLPARYPGSGSCPGSMTSPCTPALMKRRKACGVRPLDYGLHRFNFSNLDPITFLLFGTVAEGNIQLRLRFPTGWTNIPLTEGYFLYPLSKDERPSTLEITHQDGTKETMPFSRFLLAEMTRG